MSNFALGAALPWPADPAFDDPLAVAAYTRWETGADGQRVGLSSLRLTGMHCAACAGVIERALRCIPGVASAEVSAAAQCASVRWDAARVSASALVRAIEAAGYGAVPDTCASARAARQVESRAALWRLFVALFCAMQVMMLAAPAYLSAPGELPADQKRLLDWGSWLLTLPVLCFAAGPFFVGAWRSLRQRRIGMDVPVVLGALVAFVASSGAAFAPDGPFGGEVYFDSVTMFIAFLLTGRWFEMRVRHRAEAALELGIDALPSSATRLHADGRSEVVNVLRLVPGDIVRVPVGQAFAADGVLTQGCTQADEALLTGESRAVSKSQGDAVVAGSINLQAPVLMRVERAGADTRHEAIVALMREARAQRPRLLASADRWAGPFVWAVLLLALGAGAVWSVVDPARVVRVVVAVLIVTCPCALSLAAPAALLAAAGAMGRRGVMLRRLDAVEGLARMQTLFVDKTGTVTSRQLRWLSSQRLGGGEAQTIEVLQGIAASLAAWSTHPLSVALAAAFDASPQRWSEMRETPAQGLEAVDDAGQRWRLGSAAWVGATGVASDSAQAWLGCNDTPLARFAFDERLRADAAAAIHALQSDGVDVRLLSGDDLARSRRVADSLHIADAHGAMTPADKLAAVRAAQQRGEVVAMLGDGINDAPVLAQAQVSIAMGEGALVSRSQADAVLVSNRLADLVRARQLAKKALRVVHQNLLWAALYNAAAVPLALAGWMPPWVAGAGMAGSSLFVVLNAARLAR